MIRVELIHGPAKAKAAAIAWLDRVMEPGAEIPASVVLRMAKVAGISRASLLRAKARQRITSEKVRGRSGSTWTWKRPNSPSPIRDVVHPTPAVPSLTTGL
jgi:hypothetical protein